MLGRRQSRRAGAAASGLISRTRWASVAVDPITNTRSCSSGAAPGPSGPPSGDSTPDRRCSHTAGRWSSTVHRRPPDRWSASPLGRDGPNGPDRLRACGRPKSRPRARPWSTDPPPSPAHGTPRLSVDRRSGGPPARTSCSGVRRWGIHHPLRSSTNSRHPSWLQRGCPTETPSPPATGCPAPRSTTPGRSLRGATQTCELSQGIDGWSQVTQVSQRPSGDGRGAVTKSPRSTRDTTDWDPSVGSATSRWAAEEPSTRSSIETNQWPDGVTRLSA